MFDGRVGQIDINDMKIKSITRLKIWFFFIKLNDLPESWEQSLSPILGICIDIGKESYKVAPYCSDFVR